MRLPVLFVREGHQTPWTPTTIRALGKNEEFLEALIGKAPELLGLEDLRTHVKGRYASFHQLGVETPSGNTVAPDILFLTESGHVVVVEVKLADNEELRGRKVVAQVVEYAASIATYTEEDLVQLFDGTLPEDARFSDVVRKHLPSAADPVALAAELVRKIQVAEIHLVVACDQAPEGLREFVASVTAQQALGNYELRVCELVPFVGPEGAGAGLFLVPSGIVRTEVVARTVVEVTTVEGGKPFVAARVTPQDEVQANLAEAVGRTPRVAHPQIVGAISAYLRMAEPGTFERGRAPNYRYILVKGWPASTHYEFLHLKSKGTVGVELHFESEDVRAASNGVRDAALKPSAELPDLSWDQSWAKGKGRLRVLLPENVDPAVAARTMVALIRETRTIVERNLRTP